MVVEGENQVLRMNILEDLGQDLEDRLTLVHLCHH